MRRAVRVLPDLLVRRGAAEPDVSTVETLNAFQRSEFLDELCAEVAEGGNLAAFCKQRALIYKLVNRWLNDDKTRAERYALALTIREQHAKDLILGELISYLRANVTEAFKIVETPTGSHQALKDLQDMPHDLQRLVAAIEFEEVFEWQGEGKEREKVHVGRMHKIKFYDKPRNIETFMKHLQMLIERKDITVRASLADLIMDDKPAKAA